MKRILTILLILTVATIAGCYYDNEEKLYPVISTTCDLTNVTFSSTVTNALHSCQSCHSNSNASSSGAGIRLENYADVKSNTRLMGAINHLSGYSAMPKGGGTLTSCEINQIQIWINNGMPNN